MYAVILAGGGGTRLHPLSRAERPKPFLPLIGARSLLQATVERVAGLTDDVTIVTDRRYERIVRVQAPAAAVLVEPLGRNTAAAIALATLMIDRPDEEVMLVLPADQTVERPEVFREVLRTAAEHLATGAFGIVDPLVTLGIHVDRPATDYGYLIPDVARGGDVHGLTAYPLVRFEEKPKPARAEELVKQEGVAWNAGIFLWRRQAIGRALTRYTGLLQSLGPMAGTPSSLEQAYEAIQRPISIDYAVMEGAAQSGHVVMASMDVGWSDLGSWSALLTALGARGTGAVVQAGETVVVEHEDLIVRRVGGRLGVIAPPERGRMTAAQPIAILRGTAPDRALVEGLLERCSEPED
ncbi:MAG: mannose-phosphate guanylyltransferase [Chloroflexota bacterium]|jgi:mannose-1-phosphate guanylyltransferase|nr:mannose-phosphate guanylyltransferase [Chloroflexota bacterium]